MKQFKLKISSESLAHSIKMQFGFRRPGRHCKSKRIKIDVSLKIY